MSACGRTASTPSSAASMPRAGTTSTSWPRRSRPAGAAGARAGRPSWWPRQRRARPMDEPTIVTLADPDACSVAAAERIVEILDVAIDDHGEAHWATTGGSAPAGIYRHLAESLRDEIDWRKVRLWWTDERFVP